MISTGGSIIKAIEFLRRKNLGKVYVACSHAVLAGDAENRLRKAGVCKIISTNSISRKTNQVDLSEMIAENIKNWEA